MTENSPRLGLPYLMPAQAQKHVTHNEALERLDLLAQCVLAGLGSVTPPATPAPGETHALGAAPTDAWAGHAGEIAYWTGVAWTFTAPREGWRAWDAAGGRAVAYTGTAWEEIAPARLDNLEGLGVGTAADAVNRLAVASEAALFSHAGGDHRLVVNKAGPGDTAALLLQSGWSGRAEIGLAGSDDVALKVSADGSSWRTALAADAASGALAVLAGLTVGGAEAYHRGNVLGAVGSAGGSPTGALFEHASTANGQYMRAAGGLQICWHEITTSASATTDWTFPALFAAPPVCFGTPHGGLDAVSLRTALIDHDSAGFNTVDASGARVAQSLRVLALGLWS